MALDQVQDPQNLGSICRTAECAGAAGVVIPERRAAEVTPAVCKASAGAVEHLRGGAGAQPRRLPRRARERGLLVLRRERRPSAGRAPPVPYDSPDYAARGVVLVLGSEGSGLRPRVAGACDELVALPLRGRDRVAGRQRRGRALLYEILQNGEA